MDSILAMVIWDSQRLRTLTGVVMQNHVGAVSADDQRLILNSDLHVLSDRQRSTLRRHGKWPTKVTN